MYAKGVTVKQVGVLRREEDHPLLPLKLGKEYIRHIHILVDAHHRVLAPEEGEAEFFVPALDDVGKLNILLELRPLLEYVE